MDPELENHTLSFLPAETKSPEEKNATGDSPHSKDFCQTSFEHIMLLLYVLISLFGLVGNAAVIWLLGFRMRRNSFSVYVLNLACADLIFFFCNCVLYTVILVDEAPVAVSLMAVAVRSTFLVDMCLLIALCTERCVSVLCPLWYRCHRPEHLSARLCAFIWGLAFCMAAFLYFCSSFELLSHRKIYLVYYMTCLLTFVVLCGSSLTLIIQVQCFSRKRQTTRLYKTILFNVLAFLLLGLPFGIGFLIDTILPIAPYRLCVLRVLILFSILNILVNPVIYFFVGRHRQPPGWKPLGAVLQSALTDETETSQVEGSSLPDRGGRVPE